MSTSAIALEWVATEPAEPANWIEEGDDKTQISIHSYDALEAEIKYAQRIVKLENDWDGEGSPAYSQATLDRATAFLRMQFSWLWEKCSIDAPVPHINPGPEGSIDLYWKQPTWELLINIPQDEDSHASFYGDDLGTQAIKGSLDVTKPNLGLLVWLMR